MQRRTGLAAAGALALALTALAAAGAAGWFGHPDAVPERDRPSVSGPPAAVDLPTAPPGRRLVGTGRVVVAVPESWALNALDGCGSPNAPTVWFPHENTPLDCRTFPYGVASVQFAALGSNEGRLAAKHATTVSRVDGVEVRTGRFVCPPIADCLFSPSAAPSYLVVPGEDVALTLYGPERAQDLLAEIADSVRILPEGYTTVPFVPGHRPVAWNAAIAAAGLVPDAELPACDPADSCVVDPRVRPTPAPGTVVRLGSTVRLYGGGPVEPVTPAPR